MSPKEDSRRDLKKWKGVAETMMLSRAMDQLEETELVPAKKVLYQFSARGHELVQILLGQLLDHPHDAVSAYYRSRPLLLSLGLDAEDAMAGPMGRSGGYSNGRDIGVVCNFAVPGGVTVLPMAGDVGSQYTPAAGWAQSILYHKKTLGNAAYDGAISVVLGGDASVATNGFWSALTMASTLQLPMLFFVEDNGYGISVTGDFQTPGGNIVRNLSGFSGLMCLEADGTDPEEADLKICEAVGKVRRHEGPVLIRLRVPRLNGHSYQDNQAYKGHGLMEEERKRDPFRKLQAWLVPGMMSAKNWEKAEAESHQTVKKIAERAWNRPDPEPEEVGRYVFLERDDEGKPVRQQVGGVWQDEYEGLAGEAEAFAGGEDGSGAEVGADAGSGLGAEVDADAEVGADAGSGLGAEVDADAEVGADARSGLGAGRPAREKQRSTFVEAVRRTLDSELQRNPKMVVFGEDVGAKGGVHAVTQGLQTKHGAERVFDTSLSEEGIIGRAVGMAYAGLLPVAEIQFRKYADPATEQLRNAGTIRWRTANRFAAPMVVRMPGGFAKVGDPWHSESNESFFARLIGWQVASPSNAEDAVGLLRTALRSQNPTLFFEHRKLLDDRYARKPYPGDGYLLPFGKANILREGGELTVVTWGAMCERCELAAEVQQIDADILDLRTLRPWDKEAVLASVRKTGRVVIVHEEHRTAGFGAEIAAVIADECFQDLDAPVFRETMPDMPVPYNMALMNKVLPGMESIGRLMRRAVDF